MNRRFFVLFLLACGLSIPISARAQSEGKIHIVNMWTDSSFKYYAPDYLRVKVGDTVRFVNKTGSHNTQSIKGMVPEGVPAWNSKLKETFDLKITKEGVYGYKCTPHYAMGMVGVIIAGDPNVNLTKARTVNTPKKAKALFDEFFSKIERGR